MFAGLGIDLENCCIYKFLMKQLCYNVEHALGFLTITTNRLMSAMARKRLADAGADITIEQWGVLTLLWEKDGLSQDELAYIVCVDKSSISRVLDVLERRGLVSRRRDPADARRKILYATEASREIQELCRVVAAGANMDMLADVDAEELQTCLKVLAQVKSTIRTLSG